MKRREREYEKRESGNMKRREREYEKERAGMSANRQTTKDGLFSCSKYPVEAPATPICLDCSLWWLICGSTVPAVTDCVRGILS